MLSGTSKLSEMQAALEAIRNDDNEVLRSGGSSVIFGYNFALFSGGP